LLLPGKGSIGGDGHGNGESRGGRSPGKEEQGKIQDRAAEQKGDPKRKECLCTRHMGAAHEEMEDVLHEARASAAIKGGAEMEVMAMHLDEADSVKEGEHDVHQGPRVG
jgi:hypothetical protein